ncbi:serine/threonine protein kinase [Ramlibacter sp. AW1]|uniref:Stress response kinase A n=1 Tax=Ramlibacter aurantiacus TaxID=2801330 RepID=A0A936ZSB7_9BURK|nr:serine/threonine protein kinase [Ramlibacter aurantiacus]MBL0422776.1 serine/threonine protein kinase [Ramlibacter aurantiacus]
MSPSTHPYDELTPDVVLDALAAIGLHGDGRITALSSYENRVYQLPLEESWQGHAQVVAKFYRPGRWSDAAIDEEHAFAAELAAAEVPVVAPLVLAGRMRHQHAGFAFSVSPRRGGRQPELEDLEVLEWIGRFLARIHVVGATRPFSDRPALDLQGFGTASRDWLLSHDAVPLDVQGRWQQRCDEALQAIAELAPALAGAPGTGIAQLRVHGDCHPGNILWTPDAGPHFVDLDDARTAPAVQDLWMLLSGERRQRQQQLGAVLDGYEQMREFDRRELALIEPLRTLRLIHYSAWLARRWDDPAFPAAFPWFGSSDYWQGQVQMLEDQLEAMQEAPMVA